MLIGQFRKAEIAPEVRAQGALQRNVVYARPKYHYPFVGKN
jgi:hypothetical protein